VTILKGRGERKKRQYLKEDRGSVKMTKDYKDERRRLRRISWRDRHEEENKVERR
jgi:hypothetical protein